MCLTLEQFRQVEAVGAMGITCVTAVLISLWMALYNRARDLRVSRRLRADLQAERDELRLRLDYIERMDVMAAATRRALQGRSSR